jgi:hypothetical protein
MSVPITCPSCGEVGRVSNGSPGRHVRCPKCKLKFVLKVVGDLPSLESRQAARQRCVLAAQHVLAAYLSECLGQGAHAVPFYKQAENAFSASAHALGNETPDVAEAMLRFCRMRLRALHKQPVDRRAGSSNGEADCPT